MSQAGTGGNLFDLKAFKAFGKRAGQVLKGDAVFLEAHHFNGLKRERAFASGETTHHAVRLHGQDVFGAVGKALTKNR